MAMAAAAEPEGNNNPSAPSGEDEITVFESRVKGPDLRILMSNEDPLDSDILAGYKTDKMFSKILAKPGDHLDFTVQDKYIWRCNKRGEEVLCIPVAPSKSMSLHGCIIKQAHLIVGHFGPQ